MLNILFLLAIGAFAVLLIYMQIEASDKRHRCPQCQEKFLSPIERLDSSGYSHYCPHCHYKL